MPLPRSLGRFNARVTNRLLWPVICHLPGFGELEHRGRTTARTYRTPLLAFRHGDHLTIAITYGPESDWVQNVLAAGGGTFRTADRIWVLSAPRLYRDPDRRAMPWFIRPVLQLLGAADFLAADATPGGPPQVGEA